LILGKDISNVAIELTLMIGSKLYVDVWNCHKSFNFRVSCFVWEIIDSHHKFAKFILFLDIVGNICHLFFPEDVVVLKLIMSVIFCIFILSLKLLQQSIFFVHVRFHIFGIVIVVSTEFVISFSVKIVLFGVEEISTWEDVEFILPVSAFYLLKGLLFEALH
jgi:hypothetical protein